ALKIRGPFEGILGLGRLDYFSGKTPEREAQPGDLLFTLKEDLA
ncbi:hypothetical protein AK812_SmicGene48542, partial [Symbiodinium microadriaticum]